MSANMIAIEVLREGMKRLSVRSEGRTLYFKEMADISEQDCIAVIREKLSSHCRSDGSFNSAYIDLNVEAQRLVGKYGRP